MTLARRVGVISLGLLSLYGCSPADTALEPASRDWAVMGTELSITVYRAGFETETTSADLDAAFAAVAEIDALMSLYKPDSELSALNANAGNGAMAVNSHTFAVLDAAQHYAALTNGAVDITVEPLVRLWGFFDVENAAVPSQQRIDAAKKRTGMGRLALNRQSRSVALNTDTRVDLGGIAKGYGVDRALAVLRARDVPAALVNLGGTIGVLGRHPAGRPWAVGLYHPRDNRLMGEIRLRDGAVSTSGDYDRYFEHDGTRYSHIIDPRTGWPVEGVFAVTVVAPNATAADALSTAAYVLGPDEGMTLLSQCTGVDGLLVEPTSNGQALMLNLTQTNTDDVTIHIDPDPTVTVQTRHLGAFAEPDPSCVLPLERPE